MPWVELTREELYELVWSKPMLHLAKELGISDRGLAKTCRRLNIPTPGIGYWAKLQHGQSVEREELPATHDHYMNHASFFKRSKESLEFLENSSILLEAVQYEEAEANKITVPDKVHRYEAIVSQTIKNMTRISEEGMYGSGQNALSLHCSKDNFQRAACLYNTLVKCCEKRGFELTVDSYQPYINSYTTERGTFITLYDAKVQITIGEKTSRVPLDTKSPYKPGTKKYANHPNGKLYLKVTNLKDNDPFKGYWCDNADSPLEEKLNAVLLSLRRIALYKKHKQELEEVRRREKEERERKQQEEEKRIEQLEEFMESWEEANRIRNFLSALEKKDFKSASMTREDYLEWAYAYANSFDPLHELKPYGS